MLIIGVFLIVCLAIVLYFMLKENPKRLLKDASRHHRLGQEHHEKGNYEESKLHYEMARQYREAAKGEK
jgi:hypothetical protein